MEVTKEGVLYVTAAVGVVTAMLKVAAVGEPFMGSKKGKALIEFCGLVATFLLAIATLLLVSAYLPPPFGWDGLGLFVVSGVLMVAFLIAYNLLKEHAERHPSGQNHPHGVAPLSPKRRWVYLKFAKRDWKPREPADYTGAVVVLQGKPEAFLASTTTATVTAGHILESERGFIVVDSNGKHFTLPADQRVSLCTDQQITLEKGQGVTLPSGTEVIVPSGQTVTLSGATDLDLKAAS